MGCLGSWQSHDVFIHTQRGLLDRNCRFASYEVIISFFFDANNIFFDAQVQNILVNISVWEPWEFWVAEVHEICL